MEGSTEGVEDKLALREHPGQESRGLRAPSSGMGVCHCPLPPWGFRDWGATISCTLDSTVWRGDGGTQMGDSMSQPLQGTTTPQEKVTISNC